MLGHRRQSSAWWAVSPVALATGLLLTASPAIAQSASSAAPEPSPPIDKQAPAGDTSPASEKAPIDAQDVIVVGTRASLQSGIARKRNAGTIVDSIVADDIASFPDKNVGDSLARITGVQLNRDFGEGVNVSIRGVEPDLNRIEINGVSQASTQGTRSGDFRELATELVKSIDVYKGYSVDLTEGGLGGTVSIETRRPLELKKALASVVFSEQQLDTTQDWKPRITLVAGTPKLFLDGLGAIVNVTYDNVTTRQDYISNTNWSRLADFDHSNTKTVADPNYAAYNTYASCANVGGANAANATSRRLACETQFFDWAPTVPRYRNWVRHDKRISGDAQLQYEIAPNLRAYVEATINHRDQNLQDANYSLDMGRYQRYQLDPTLPAGLNGGTSRPQIKTGSATVDDNHVVTSYTTALGPNAVSSTVNSGSSNILGIQRRAFTDEQYSYYYQGGFSWDLNRLHVKGLGSHSLARDIGNNALISITTSVPGVTVDRRNSLGIPAFQFPSTVNPADYTIYTANAATDPYQAGPTIQWRPNDYGNTENQGKLDATYDTDLPLLKSVQFGGQARWQDYYQYLGGGTRLLDNGQYQTASYYSYTTNIVKNVTARQTIGATGAGNNTATYQLTPAEYIGILQAANGLVPGGAPLFSGLQNAPSGIPGQFAVPVFDTSVLGKYYDLSKFNQSQVRSANGLPQIPGAQIDERVLAGYLRLNLDTNVFGMHLTGNGGIRYTNTRDSGTGTNIARVTTLNAAGTPVTTVVASQQISIRNNYSDVLPAFNLALEITPDLVLRANWAKNVARPKPLDLVPNINCLDDQSTGVLGQDACTAGNPKLKPYRATQWELNLAWYPNRDSLVSLGYYKKFESSFVIGGVTRSDVDLFGDGILYTVRQPINGFGALLDGFEASAQTAFTFLPRPFDGFGASGNFTYARALTTNLTNLATNQPLNDYPGLSKYTWNASIFYDKDWLNVRVNYNYRSDWLATSADSNNGNNPIYRKAEGYLDGKITIRVPKYHFSVFVEAQNINREYQQTYIKNLGPVDLYYPGRRFFTGIQAKF